jgi:hypothetical protein
MSPTCVPVRLAVAAGVLSRGTMGLKSLPPETACFIDQIKSRRQI